MLSSSRLIRPHRKHLTSAERIIGQRRRDDQIVEVDICA